MRPAERASSPAEQDSKRPQAPASAKGNEPKAAGAGPKTAEGHGPKRKVTARHVLRALAPSDDAANAQASRDPTSKKLWALVQPRLGKARTVAPAQAAPSTEALRKLIRAAQRRPGD